ncbi:MAG TPA: hypothetical protein VHS56_05105 [Candidatus Cybelea sp.]|jgi:hypothetical protein|nr:hypothetical protein [Candidatus Cybelea sp.]
MPKRLMIALAVAALAVAACHSNNTVTPTPSSTPVSPSPNPKDHKATAEVTSNGTPVPLIPVEISTPANPASPRPGTPFDTEITGKKGMAHFLMLDPKKTYCWVAVFGSGHKSSDCAGWEIWQTSTILLGT